MCRIRYKLGLSAGALPILWLGSGLNQHKSIKAGWNPREKKEQHPRELEVLCRVTSFSNSRVKKQDQETNGQTMMMTTGASIQL